MRVQLLTLVGAVIRSPVGTSPYSSGVFTYEHGGDDWTAGRCASREKQSPIAFEKADEALPVAGSFLFRYHKVASPVEMYATLTSFVVELNGLGVGGLTLDGGYYNLMNVKFKVQAEHPISGTRLPAEVQLVHKHAVTDEMLIVAIPITSPSSAQLNVAAPANNASNSSNATHAFLAKQPVEVVPSVPGGQGGDYNLERILHTPAPIPNTKAEVPLDIVWPLDLAQWMEGTYWRYGGSLTSPPCGLGVTWLVRQQQLDASDAQVDALRDALLHQSSFGNSRNTMPRNMRPVSVFRAEKDPDDYAAVTVDADRYAYRSDRNLATRDLTNQALKDLKATVGYMRSLDNRLARGAAAHSAVLHGNEPPLPPGVSETVPLPADWKVHVDSLRDHIVGAVAKAAGITTPPTTSAPTTAMVTTTPMVTTPAPTTPPPAGNATAANGTNGSNASNATFFLQSLPRRHWWFF
jgi:carbonic anhydrase